MSKVRHRFIVLPCCELWSVRNLDNEGLLYAHMHSSVHLCTLDLSSSTEIRPVLLNSPTLTPFFPFPFLSHALCSPFLATTSMHGGIQCPGRVASSLLSPELHAWGGHDRGTGRHTDDD